MIAGFQINFENNYELMGSNFYLYINALHFNILGIFWLLELL